MENVPEDSECALEPDGNPAATDQASRGLEAIADYELVLRSSLDSVVPGMGDLAVLVVEQRGFPPRVEVAHTRPSVARRLRREVGAALESIRQAAFADVSDGRHARFIPVITETWTRLLTRQDPGLTRLLTSFDVRSMIIVGLRAGGRTIGGLAVCRCEDSPIFSAAEFGSMQVLARRIALVIETASLQEQLHRQVQSQSTVREAIHKWVRVFDLAWWGAAVVDGLDRRLEAVNPAFARLHGYADRQDLRGRLFAELLPEDRKGELDVWRSHPEGQVYESAHLRPDGSLVPVLVSVTPLEEGASSDSYVVTIQDLTDLKRAEERLQRAQRMEAVGRLAGGVAHEVNNMMTIILGFSDLLARELEDGGATHRELDEIRKAAQRAARITTQLLAFSRQQVLQPVDLKLSQVVNEMVPVLRLMLPANVRVETALSPIDAVVRADRSQLEQVLINLAFNARDAMASGGLIKVTTEIRKLDEATGRRLIGIPIPAGRYGLVSVVDTGHGMDQTTLAQVFEPFFTTKPTGSGTGLGLSTVYGIVKQSGGYVWADSTQGQGTTFTICLPEVVGTDAAGEDETPDEPGQQVGGGTVLILEDEDGVRELAVRLLRDRGYSVLQARNGSEALAQLKKSEAQPQLLLTDVIVPDMGTGELEQEVHGLRPELPILYMSGYPRDDILSRGLLRSDQPFLQKPFTGADLLHFIEGVLRRV